MTNSDDTQVVKPLPYGVSGRKGGWIIGLVCLMVLLVALVALFRANSADNSVDGLKKDVADIITLKANVATLQKDMSALDKKVDGVVTATESLIENANALTDKVAALNSDVATKADKSALSRLATKSRLKRVEETLEEYLLVEAAKETIPLANGENKSAVGESEDDGTITVIVRPVPVDDEQ